MNKEQEYPIDTQLGATGNTPIELWRRIEGTDGWYEVSNTGKVRSWRKGRWDRRETPRLLKHTIGSHGYPTIQLSMGKKGVAVKTVHSLVMETFVGPKPSGMCVCHNDGNKLNPHVSNLRYGTQADNLRDEAISGRASKYSTPESRPTAKLGWNDVNKIRSYPSHISHVSISKEYPVGADQISLIRRNKSWKVQ